MEMMDRATVDRCLQVMLTCCRLAELCIDISCVCQTQLLEKGGGSSAKMVVACRLTCDVSPHLCDRFLCRSCWQTVRVWLAWTSLGVHQSSTANSGAAVKNDPVQLQTLVQ